MRQARNDLLLILLAAVFYMTLLFARYHFRVYLPLVLAPAPDGVLSTPVAVTREP